MDNRAFASATELANHIRGRRIGCVELLDFYLARAERHNPELNAMCISSRRWKPATATSPGTTNRCIAPSCGRIPANACIITSTSSTSGTIQTGTPVRLS
jgi:hypothetical protein